jgi:hypothetical protein
VLRDLAILRGDTTTQIEGPHNEGPDRREHIRQTESRRRETVARPPTVNPLRQLGAKRGIGELDAVAPAAKVAMV